MVLHPTAIAQWQALVNEASAALGKPALSEELESYLVFLLMRFTGNPGLSSSIMALEFLKSIELLKTARESYLRDVGDKCLLFAGFFPEMAHRRRVKMSYYVDLGRSAYASLSSVHHRALSDLFANLSHDFVLLVDVLHSMRTLDSQKEDIDLLSAEELWCATNSQYAWNVLKKQLPTLSSASFSREKNQVKH